MEAGALPIPAADGALARGTVARLFRWPVKSLGGEELRALTLGANGVPGDRAHLVHDGEQPRRRLSGTRSPRLMAWSAAYPDEDDARPGGAEPPTPVVTAPGGRRFAWEDPALAEALAGDLGRPVVLRRRPQGAQSRGATVHVTFEATRRAVEEALGFPLDVRRFRSNLHLELDAPPFAEDAWVGRRIEVGEATLRVTERCERCVVPTRDPDAPGDRRPELLRWLADGHDTCFGLIATVEREGAVAVGTAARVAGD